LLTIASATESEKRAPFANIGQDVGMGANALEKGIMLEEDDKATHHASFIQDPFRSFDDLPDEKSRVLTIRAVFVGICCGALVNASNVYLGLKSGWTFSANLFGVCISQLLYTDQTKLIDLLGHCRLCRHQGLLSRFRRELPHPWR
jgi:OPT oligopeptide transporter protein